MIDRSAAAIRIVPTTPEAEEPIPETPDALARLYLEMAERHRERGDSPRLVAALVRSAWRLRFGA